MFIIKNKYENIEILDLEDEDDLLDAFGTELLNHREDEIVSIVSRADLIGNILSELLSEGYNIGKMFFDPNDMDNDYCLSVDSECNISINLVDYLDGFDNKDVIFVNMDKADQVVIDYCIGIDKKVYLFEIGGESDECDCESCDCKDNCHEYDGTTDNDNNFHITIKGDLDLGEAIAKIEKIETRMARISDFFDETNEFMSLLRL